MGLSIVLASLSAGGTLASTLTGVYGVVGGSLISLAGSALINTAISSIFGLNGNSQQNTRQSIAQHSELPFKRHVRGRCFATGTPLPGVAKDGFYYVAYLLNSRESEGNFELYLDNRVLQSTGDPYDFSGDGAQATNGLFNEHVSYWISRGDETSPPDVFTDEALYDATDNPLGYKTTDGGQGCTIVWMKLKRGGDDSFQDRWPSYPFVNLSILGDWSKVWDPRDPAQVSTDTSTHTFSRNAALHALDIVMQNPFRTIGEDAIDLPMWIAAANACDDPIALKSGGTEPRYQVGGTTLFDGSELAQLSKPILNASASTLVYSSGVLGIVPGVAKNAVKTITDVIKLPTISTIAAPENQYDEVHVQYYPLDRDGEPASLIPWAIPNVVPDGLPRVLVMDLGMVGSATQAMRLRKIAGLKTTYVKKLTGMVFWPDEFDLLLGSWAGFDLGFTQMTGTFEITQFAPLESPVGDEGGMALRITASATETSDLVYEWDGATEEEQVDIYEYIYDEESVKTGGPISIETGQTVNLDTGGTIIPRVKFTFAPSDTANISAYQVQVAEQGEPYSDSFTIDGETRDASGDVFGYFQGIGAQPYDFRVRAIAATGFSDYVEFSGATPVVDIDIDAPTDGAAVGGIGEITASFRTPNDADFRSIEFWGSDTDDVLAATIIGSAIFTSQNTVVSITEGNLGASVTRYYFARSRGDYGSASDFTASVSATTDP